MRIKTLTNKQVKNAPYADATTIDCIKEGTIVAVNVKKVTEDSRGIKWYEIQNGYISEMFCEIIESKKEKENSEEEKTNSEE